MFWIALSAVLSGTGFYLIWRECNPFRRQCLAVSSINESHLDITKSGIQPRREGPRRGVQDVCFIGSGYVGALTAIVLAFKNPDTNFSVVDRNERLIAAWNSDQIPLFEPGLEDILFSESCWIEPNGSKILRRSRLQNITFSTAMNECIISADIVFICVDTPLNGSSDSSNTPMKLNLTNIRSAVQRVAEVATHHQTIVLKSTVPCGVVDEIQDLLEEKAAPAASFDVLSSPEFLAQGSAIQDLLFPNRVVIGQGSKMTDSVTELKGLYRWVPAESILTMDTYSSELSKIASNAFIGQRISSINSLSALCESVGANVHDVSKVIGSEPRVGPLSLRAGFGFGGSCLHKDICCLIYLAQEMGLPEVAEYWKSVISINNWQNRRILDRLLSHLHGVMDRERGPTIAILGLTFKKDTLDTRNSTAIDMIQGLLRCGAKLRLYEPHLSLDQIESVLGSAASEMVVSSIEAACQGCNALVIHTNWDDFKDGGIQWNRISSAMESPKLLLDPWGITDHYIMEQTGFRSMEIGASDEFEKSLLPNYTN